MVTRADLQRLRFIAHPLSGQAVETFRQFEELQRYLQQLEDYIASLEARIADLEP